MDYLHDTVPGRPEDDSGELAQEIQSALADLRVEYRSVFVMYHEQGQPYEDIGWELWAPVRPLYDAGDYRAAADAALEVAEANPSYPALWYNLACCESRAGRLDAAMEHLGRAVGMSERLAGLARDDSDFDPIRGKPGFSELVDA